MLGTPADFKLMKKLGSGASSRVYLAKDPKSGQLVAIKELSAHGASERKQLETELGALRTIGSTTSLSQGPRSAQRGESCANVITFFGAHMMDPSTCVLALEYMEGGSLLDVIGRHGALSSYAVSALASDVFNGLLFLQSLGLMHRDIKPANVLLSGSGVAKLADFGISFQLRGAGAGSGSTGPAVTPMNSVTVNVQPDGSAKPGCCGGASASAGGLPKVPEEEEEEEDELIITACIGRAGGMPVPPSVVSSSSSQPSSSSDDSSSSSQSPVSDGESGSDTLTYCEEDSGNEQGGGHAVQTSHENAVPESEAMAGKEDVPAVGGVGTAPASGTFRSFAPPLSEDVDGVVTSEVIGGATVARTGDSDATVPVLHSDTDQPGSEQADTLQAPPLAGLDLSVNEFCGSCAYMSPERIKGDAYSINSDVWAAGCVLFEAF
jgi:serine/threonine protein kinase